MTRTRIQRTGLPSGALVKFYDLDNASVYSGDIFADRTGEIVKTNPFFVSGHTPFDVWISGSVRLKVTVTPPGGEETPYDVIVVGSGDDVDEGDLDALTEAVNSLSVVPEMEDVSADFGVPAGDLLFGRIGPWVVIQVHTTLAEGGPWLPSGTVAARYRPLAPEQIESHNPDADNLFNGAVRIDTDGTLSATNGLGDNGIAESVSFVGYYLAADAASDSGGGGGGGGESGSGVQFVVNPDNPDGYDILARSGYDPSNGALTPSGVRFLGPTDSQETPTQRQYDMTWVGGDEPSLSLLVFDPNEADPQWRSLMSFSAGNFGAYAFMDWVAQLRVSGVFVGSTPRQFWADPDNSPGATAPPIGFAGSGPPSETLNPLAIPDRSTRYYDQSQWTALDDNNNPGHEDALLEGRFGARVWEVSTLPNHRYLDPYTVPKWHVAEGDTGWWEFQALYDPSFSIQLRRTEQGGYIRVNKDAVSGIDLIAALDGSGLPAGFGIDGRTSFAIFEAEAPGRGDGGSGANWGQAHYSDNNFTLVPDQEPGVDSTPIFGGGPYLITEDWPDLADLRTAGATYVVNP